MEEFLQKIIDIISNPNLHNQFSKEKYIQSIVDEVDVVDNTIDLVKAIAKRLTPHFEALSKNLAEGYYKFYSNLQDAGFSKDEAMQILLQLRENVAKNTKKK